MKLTGLLLTLVVAIVCLGLVMSFGEDKAPSKPDEIVGTANDPHYEIAANWPADVKKSAYFAQKWPEAKLFVWVPSGKTGKQTDPQDTPNWTVNGQPATTVPGENVDILFPVGATIHIPAESSTTLTVRHITIEQGVHISNTLRLRPLGNAWIKKSADVDGMTSYSGPNNVFLRNDNHTFTVKKADGKVEYGRGVNIGNKIVFNKPVGSSIEIIGMVMAGDECGMFCGTVIVGPDSALIPGNRSSQAIYPDGKLVLMDGASFYKRGNQPYETDLIVSGELLAGLPNRPLTRDCFLGLSFKTKGVKGIVVNPGHASASDYGMIINPSGKLLVYSADPKKAQLVIKWNGLGSGLHAGAGEVDPVERKIDLVLQGKLELAAVRFENIRAGGIRVADPKVLQNPGVTYGDKNEGSPTELVSVLAKPIEAKLLYSAARTPLPASKGQRPDDARENR